jgi:hypothetical protein
MGNWYVSVIVWPEVSRALGAWPAIQFELAGRHLLERKPSVRPGRSSCRPDGTRSEDEKAKVLKLIVTARRRLACDQHTSFHGP